MNKIASFEIDHTRLEPGIYVSRCDKLKCPDDVHNCFDHYVTTFDLRFVKPNSGEYLSQSGLHTIEHLGATFLRNCSDIGNQIIYFGPMGCRTGFYLIIDGYKTSINIYDQVYDMLNFIINYNGKIPGTKPKECGNYQEHSLKDAKKYAKMFRDSLFNRPNFVYPK